VRILVIIGAYLVSCLAAATVLMAATALTLPPIDNRIAHLLGAAFLLTPFVAGFAALPASAIIAYAERYDRRSEIFYAAAAVAVAVICLGVLNIGFYAVGWHRERPMMDAGYFVRLAGMLASYVFAALVAGLTYWWIAGHRRPTS
jgi:hypothetical protein